MNWPNGTIRSTDNDFTYAGASIFRKRAFTLQANGMTISETAAKLRADREVTGTMIGLSRKSDKRLAR